MFEELVWNLLIIYLTYLLCFIPNTFLKSLPIFIWSETNTSLIDLFFFLKTTMGVVPKTSTTDPNPLTKSFQFIIIYCKIFFSLFVNFINFLKSFKRRYCSFIISNVISKLLIVYAHTIISINAIHILCAISTNNTTECTATTTHIKLYI